jgi:hypothetical protein
MTTACRALPLVALLLATTSAGHAQIGINTNTIVGNAINQQRFNSLMANQQFNLMMAGRQAGGVRRAALAGKRLPRNGSPTATVFAPSKAAIAPQKLATRYAKTASERDDLARVAHGLLQAYRGSLKPNGGRENDLAHVLGYFLRTNYLVYNNGKGELTREQADGLVEILRAFIVEYPAFKTMSDREKQEHYETFAILGTYVISAYEAARKRNDAGLLPSLRSMARAHIEEILGPLESIALTSDGFMYK